MLGRMRVPGLYRPVVLGKKHANDGGECPTLQFLAEGGYHLRRFWSPGRLRPAGPIRSRPRRPVSKRA